MCGHSTAPPAEPGQLSASHWEIDAPAADAGRRRRRPQKRQLTEELLQGGLCVFVLVACSQLQGDAVHTAWRPSFGSCTVCSLALSMWEVFRSDETLDLPPEEMAKVRVDERQGVEIVQRRRHRKGRRLGQQ